MKPDQDAPTSGDRATSGSQEAANQTTVISRRDRARLATIEEIKSAACRLLTPASHAGDLSLRAVAREIGLTPSAIYRYFDSRQELMESLARDAFESLGDTLKHATRTTSANDSREAAVTVCHAYRRWCLDHPAEFTLIFGTHRDAAPEQWALDVIGFFRLPLVTLHRELGRGETTWGLDPLREKEVESLIDPRLLPLAEQVAGGPIPPSALFMLTSIWASVHGLVCLEMFGHAGHLSTDVERTFDLHVRDVLASMTRS